MKISKKWLITGASKGLGLQMVKELLAQDQTVIATTRDKNSFDSEIVKSPKLSIYELDLTKEQDVKDCIDATIKEHDAIDVLINNAGYGFVGAIEETDEHEVEKVVNLNVFCTLRMIRNVLPYMRNQKSGHIINLSSMAGLKSSAGWGIYNTSKYAVEGFSEALAEEVKQFGIHVILIEPGAFRTQFLDSSLHIAHNSISAYNDTVGAFKEKLSDRNGKQPGNPKKAAEAIFKVGMMENPPLRVLLGKDAYKNAQKKIEMLNADFEHMKELTFSTEFED